MSQVQWYFVKDGQEQGPVSPQELKELASSGALKPNDLVRKDGKVEWTPAGKMKGLIPGYTPPPEAGDRSKENVKEQMAAIMDRAHETLEKAQVTIAAASEKADEVAGILWFLDLKFKYFVTPKVVPWVWTIFLIIAPLMYVGGIIGALFTTSFTAAIWAAIVGIFYFPLMGLVIRIGLETSMAVFRTAAEVKRVGQSPPSV